MNRATLTLLLKHPLGLLGLCLIGLFGLVAVLAPVLAPIPDGTNFIYGVPERIPQGGVSPIPVPPNATHRLGLTQDGFDLYAGLVWGTRTAFLIGLTVTFACALIGSVVGSLAGYFGGWLDHALMRLTDVVFAFPLLVLLIVLVLILGRDLHSIMLAIIVLGWANYARIVRSEVLKVTRHEYVEGARALGAAHPRVLFRHVLPNSLTSVLALASFDIGTTVLTAAGLSFLGLGAPTGFPDWGQLVSLSRQWVTAPEYWFTYVLPGGTIIVFALAWNFLSEALRDVTNPRGFRGRRSRGRRVPPAV